jgi:AcrR family transcriptional regulator
MPFTRDETTRRQKTGSWTSPNADFSDDGASDATRRGRYCRRRRVNKALIYYYFKSKQAILDHLIQTLFDDLKSLDHGFRRLHVVSMIRDGRLVILRGRWRFTTQEDARAFAARRWPDTMRTSSISCWRAGRSSGFSFLNRSKTASIHNDIIRRPTLLGSRDEDSIYRAIHERTGLRLYGGHRAVQVLFRLPADPPFRRVLRRLSGAGRHERAAAEGFLPARVREEDGPLYGRHGYPDLNAAQTVFILSPSGIFDGELNK